MKKKTMKKKTEPRKVMTEKEVSLVVQETEKVIQSLDPLPAKIRKLNMAKDGDYEILLEEGRTTREFQRQVVAKQKWTLAPFDEAKKRTKSLFCPMLTTCTEVLELIDQKQTEYFQIQDRKQEEEQERLDAEAAEEQKRLEKNAKAKAKRLQAKGEDSLAREVIAEVPKVEVAEAQEIIPPKVAGVSRAKIWDVEIIASEEVPEFHSQTGLPDPLYMFWERKFNRETLLKVRALVATEDNPQPIPGVRFFQKPSTRYGRL